MLITVPLATTGPLVEASFVSRPNQFLVEARLGGRIISAHMADRGRLLDLLTPAARLLLAPRDEIGRKTAYQVVGVYAGDELVSLNTELPNQLVAAALASGALPQFARYTRLQREVSVGEHRFDFKLGEGLASCYIEVKSATSLVNGLAFFPDAPIERGRRQVDKLSAMSRNGLRCALLFIVQRQHARGLAPNDEVDPDFARALRFALANGVEVYAYLCPLTPVGLQLGEPLPFFANAESVPLNTDA